VEQKRSQAILKTEMPLLSVITPVYNGVDFLEETLQSLVLSDYPNIEFIVVNDGSKDGSGELAEKVLSAWGRTYQVINKENSGEADSDNVALAASKGSYIAIVNADDPVYPQLFSKSIAALEADPKSVTSYPDWDMIDESGKVIRVNYCRDYSLDSLIGDNICLPGPGAVIRRSAIKSPILRDPKFRFTSDYRQWLSLSLEGHFLRVPEVLCTWRIHSAQQTVQAAGIVQAKEMISCIEDFYSTANLPPKVLSLKTQSFSQAYYLAAIQSLHRKGVPGRRYLLESLRRVYRRGEGYSPLRREFIVMAMIAFNPLGRWAVSFAKARTNGFLKRKAR
jgi:glycosyltransferase involved in cell wall biosynthesis